MPWQVRSAMEMKKEFVQFATQPGANVRGLCRRYGVSPETGYKWLRRRLSQSAEARAGRRETWKSSA